MKSERGDDVATTLFEFMMQDSEREEERRREREPRAPGAGGDT